MNIWTITRKGVISDAEEAAGYDINTDAISMDASNFEVKNSDEVIFEDNGFLLAKFHGGKFAYFGLLSSFENDTLVANDLIKLLDFEFPATKGSGSSFEQHAKNLITRYLINDTGKNMSILNIEVRTNTKHIYQPSEPPTPTNLMSYMINGFKKYNVVWRFDRFENGKIYTVIEAPKDTIQLKDNIFSITDWDMSTTEVGKGIVNHLLIVDKTTNNMEAPKVLSQWWLTTDNEVTSNANHAKIFKPTKTKVWIYDTKAEDKPTYQEVAEAEIKGSYYAHELSFKMIKNELVDIDKLYIGLFVTIIKGGRIFKSVLTGIRMTSDGDAIEFSFGHIRSRFTELLN